MHFLCRAVKEKPGNRIHSFEIFWNGIRVELVKIADKEPAETCLQIYAGNADDKFLEEYAGNAETALLIL